MIIGLKSALAMLKRKKLQSFLTGLTIMLTAVLIYMGLSLMNQTAPFHEMYDRANGSENLLFLKTELHDVDNIKVWLKNNKSVESVNRFKSHLCNLEFTKEHEKISTTVFLTEFEESSKQDMIYVSENEKSSPPKSGEIYVTYNFASTNQLEIGDTVKTNVNGQTYELIVAKLIVDPQFSNEFMSPARCFVHSDFFQNHQVITNTTFLGIKYKDYTLEKEKALKKAFDSYMINSMQPSFITYSEIDDSYNMIGNLIASAMLLISIFMFIIVVFIIRTTIRNEIMQQYKTIGVRKVIGYNKKQIKEMFLFTNIIIGIIASVIGVFLGVPIRNVLVERLTGNLQVGVKFTFDWFIVLTIIIILGLLFVFVTLAANRANKIKPIQAIKYGVPENKLKRTNFKVDKLKKTPLSIILAVKQMLMNKMKTTVSIVSITIITFVSLSISNITGSLLDSKHFSKYLIGVTPGDVTVTYSSDITLKEVIEKLESINNVERVVYADKNLSENILSKDDTENISVLGTTIYGDASDTIIILSDGRQPINNEEVVISSPLVEKTGKAIGDYITIKKADGDKKYLITGLYDSVYHSGSSYVIIEKEIPEEQKHNNGYYWLYMSAENVIIEEIETSIIDLFGDDVSVAEYSSDALQIINTTKPIPAVTNMILAIFLIVCGVIIFNWTIIDINKSVKVYGILKATGFSNRQLKVLLIAKSIIQTLIGLFLGYVLCALTIEDIMLLMFKATPFSTIKLPVIFSHSQGFLITMLYCLISLIATLIPAKRIGRISPKNLISE